MLLLKELTWLYSPLQDNCKLLDQLQLVLCGCFAHFGVHWWGITFTYQERCPLVMKRTEHLVRLSEPK